MWVTRTHIISFLLTSEKVELSTTNCLVNFPAKVAPLGVILGVFTQHLHHDLWHIKQPFHPTIFWVIYPVLTQRIHPTFTTAI